MEAVQFSLLFYNVNVFHINFNGNNLIIIKSESQLGICDKEKNEGFIDYLTCMPKILASNIYSIERQISNHKTIGTNPWLPDSSRFRLTGPVFEGPVGEANYLV